MSHLFDSAGVSAFRLSGRRRSFRSRQGVALHSHRLPYAESDIVSGFIVCRISAGGVVDSVPQTPDAGVTLHSAHHPTHRVRRPAISQAPNFDHQFVQNRQARNNGTRQNPAPGSDIGGSPQGAAFHGGSPHKPSAEQGRWRRIHGGDPEVAAPLGPGIQRARTGPLAPMGSTGAAAQAAPVNPCRRQSAKRQKPTAVKKAPRSGEWGARATRGRRARGETSPRKA
jgi:hypothetical protein